MATKFVCKLSGNFVSFEHAHDIESMRKHPDYEEVVSEKTPEVTPQVTPEVPVVVKKMGRPTKQKE